MNNVTVLRNSADSAVIEMYGEVIDQLPKWVRDEIGEGCYIECNEVRRQLDNLKGAGVKDLTLKLNTVGGDYYAGLALRNHILELGMKVDTVNMALAASAGSILMQAACNGGKRRVCSASNTMVHPVSGYLHGYYNRGDLEKQIKQMDAADKAAAECYAQSRKVSREQAQADMQSETWMTGEEAVAKGYADEVIEGAGQEKAEAQEMMLDAGYRLADRSGALMNAGWLRLYNTLPANVKQVESLPMAEEEAKKEEEAMEIKNLAELRAAHPELCAELENSVKAQVGQQHETDIKDKTAEAVKNALDAERKRLDEIDKIAGQVADEDMVNDAKYVNPISAAELALKAMQAQAAAGMSYLKDIAEDNKNSLVDKVAGGAQSEDDEEKSIIAFMTGSLNR